MRHVSCLVLFLLLFLPAAAHAQATPPDTPAGRTFSAWLAAFNSGDQSQLDAYYHKYDPGKSASDIMPFANRPAASTSCKSSRASLFTSKSSSRSASATPVPWRSST